LAQTSAFCRAQEALQLDRAAGATLENVRAIASKAAIAWGREAELAEQREVKQGRSSSSTSTLPEAASISEEDEDDAFEENRDRDSAAG
jgi:hypothetical protein